jgi:hypothetical protein
MNITVRITSNYGCRTVYPACPTSELLAKLAGTKTLTPGALELIKQMGYTVNVQQEQL